MKALAIVGGLIGAVVVAGIVIAMLLINANNTAVRHEKGIEAQYTEMENVLGQYSLKVVEAAKIPDMATQDLKEVMRGALSARYGEGGSQAAFQWIKETYPGQVDPALYQKIQQIIEGGRNKFENAQTMLIDRKRAYEEALGMFPSGVLMKIVGFPKIDLSKFNIISSGHAKEAFATGVDKPIDIK